MHAHPIPVAIAALPSRCRRTGGIVRVTAFRRRAHAPTRGSIRSTSTPSTTTATGKAESKGQSTSLSVVNRVDRWLVRLAQPPGPRLVIVKAGTLTFYDASDPTARHPSVRGRRLRRRATATWPATSRELATDVIVTRRRSAPPSAIDEPDPELQLLIRLSASAAHPRFRRPSLLSKWGDTDHVSQLADRREGDHPRSDHPSGQRTGLRDCLDAARWRQRGCVPDANRSREWWRGR